MIRAINGNPLLHEVAGYLLERQNVISSNIANINSPNYTRKELQFEKELQAELASKRENITKTHSMHATRDDNYEDDDSTIIESKNFNNVHGQDSIDIDKEMSLMAKNHLMYNSIMTLIARDFNGAKSILSKIE